MQVERAALVKDLDAMRVAMDATIERERKALYAAISVSALPPVLSRCNFPHASRRAAGQAGRGG
jgi:hypothetical protein